MTHRSDSPQLTLLARCWHVTCQSVRVMSVQTRDFVDVATRARELGCRLPVRIALLPGNFSTAAHVGEFCYHAATPYVRAAWQSVGLKDEGPDSESGIRDSGLVTSSGFPTPVPSPQSLTTSQHDRVPSGIQGACRIPDPQPDANNENAKVRLAVFFGAGLSDGSAWRVAIALGMVSSVLASDSRCASPRDVRLDVVVERTDNHGCACIEYQGDAFGIVALSREVRRIWAGK